MLLPPGEKPDRTVTDMEKRKEDNMPEGLELRSERMRRVINDRPPFIIQWGTVIVTLVLAVLALLSGHCFV